MLELFLVFLASYLLGSIPTGYISVKLLHGIDVRKHGSGNTGATNVYRVGGLKAAVITAIGDIGKGVVAIELARALITEPALGLQPKTIQLICALLVIAGHNWSVFLSFKGGKGVATTAGVLIVLMPYLLPGLLLAWLGLVILTRYVSLASIAAGIMIPVLIVIFREPAEYIFFGIMVAIFVVYRHRSNIQRLIQGKENRLEWGKNKPKRVR